jgi:hypothetical protein
VSPVKYELRFYIPEDDNPYSHSRENLKSYNGSKGRWRYSPEERRAVWASDRTHDGQLTAQTARIQTEAAFLLLMVLWCYGAMLWCRAKHQAPGHEDVSE